jgi:hypothetical protein
MKAFGARITWFGATILAVGCAAGVLAQERNNASDAGGSLAALTAEEQQARSREGELSQAMQLEDARWSDLISRLEQLIKR